ncbi:PIGT [Cordylochernes scorpioides]|uniref:PIGT n=1 Tax=Cordylochernes scorpioides TaxID=51811 RepID=A0ABY6KFV0_9ARAC|nr:PIGT [Cordylochernes scorpioides]
MPGHRKRRQFKQTDAFTRGMVIVLKRAGWSIRQIAADTHLGASTVHRLWRRWLEQGNVAIYRNVDATRVTSARVDRRILRQAVAAPQATCTAILQHVQDTLDHSISTRTISRRLVANGLHSCRPLRRLPLTPPNRRQRLEWCRARSTWMTEWHRVVFSDESRFCLSSDSRRVRVWRRRGERSNQAAIVERPTVRQRGIMGTMTAQRYVDDVLRPVTLPYLQGVPNALYQQDNARPHTARISQQALQDVQMLPWPPYSPDLSPIEHVWDIIGRRLHALPQPRSEDELWQMVEREWSAIPQDAIRTLTLYLDVLLRASPSAMVISNKIHFDGLWSMVDPGETKPKEADHVTLSRFNSRQNKALAKICLSIGDEQQQHVRNSPKEVWAELEKLFGHLAKDCYRLKATKHESHENHQRSKLRQKPVCQLDEMTVANTLLVPDIKTGVISVLQAVENDRKVIFNIDDDDDNLLIEAERRDNKEKPPFEWWFGWKSSLQHLRACGFEVFVHIPRERRSKLQPRALRGILVGYALHGHGWRIWIPEKNQHRGKEVPTAWSHPLRHHTKEDETVISSKMELTDCGGITGSRKTESYPSSYQEAIESLEATRWLTEIEEEMESLRKPNVWGLGELPKDVTPIPCRWVLHKKTNVSGEVTRYKVCLVAKGFGQHKGLDFNGIYAPVSSFETIRLLTANGIERGWHLDQFVVKNAYGNLDKIIYMEQPEVRDLIRQLKVGDLIEDSAHIWCDSQAAITHTKNYVDRSGTRDKYHFIREKIQYVLHDTDWQDMMTGQIQPAEGQQVIPEEGVSTDFKVFPRSIGEIINKYKLNQLHLSLTQGLWHHKKWGYPVYDAPSGAKLWAYFHPSTSDISAEWFGLVNSLSGQYCASLNFIDSTSTIKPTFPLGEKTRNASLFRYAALPRETVCTENLTPWTKLLPCDNKAGLASLFRAIRLFNSNYLSLGLDIRTQCQGQDSCNTLLQQTLDVVLDPLRTSFSKKQDWSFFQTFGSKLMQTCPLSAETKIFVDTASNLTFPFSLSPKPTHQDTERNLAVYNVNDGMPLNVAASYANSHVHWLIPPPYLYSSCHIQGRGVERGGLVCEIHNRHPAQELRVYFQAIVPWFLRVYHHTMTLTVPGRSLLSPDVSLYQPALDRIQPHLLEMEFSIPRRSTARLSVQFDRAFLKWTEYPPDPNHGFYVGSCLVSTSSLASPRNRSLFPGSW